MADKEDFVYHEKIGFPPEVSQKLEDGIELKSLEPTLHALERAKKSYYLDDKDKQRSKTKIQIPDEATVTNEQAFEVGVNESGEITKLGFRYPELEVINSNNNYEDFELCLIVDPQTMEVITLYLNYSDDEHDTLEIDDYNEPTEFPN